MEIRQPKFQINDEVRFIDKDKPGIFLICSIADYDFKEDKYSFELVPFSMDASPLNLGCIAENNLQLYRKAPRSIWELKNGDSYFYTDENGNIKEEMFAHDPSLLSKRKFLFGNVFLNQKEAAQDLLRRLVETKLLKLSGRRWYDPHEDNYYITYNYANHSIVYVWSRMSCMQGTIFFNSESEAEEAVAEIGERQIKKALFGVDE